VGKFLKWTFAILFFLVGLGGFLNMLQTERGPSTPERLMLTSTGSNVVEVAACDQHDTNPDNDSASAVLSAAGA